VPPARVPNSPEALFGLYRSLLSGRRLLIVLDNARDVNHVRPLLPGSPGCLALVTSRHRLVGLLAADGARSLILDVLLAAQSRDVLRERLGAARVAGEPEAVESIVARCGGLPLALSIAAARAAIRPEFPLAVLATQLQESAQVLDMLRGDDDPATDLRAVFSWSYRALSPTAADLFRLLGLLAGPDIGVAAAASLAGLPVSQAGQVLAELVGASLVTEAKPGRYALHDLLRAYAADLAPAAHAPEERNAALRRLLDHYLHTAHAGAVALHPPFSPIDLPTPAPGAVRHDLYTASEAHAWFDQERATLLAVVPQAARHGFEGHAWRLAWTLSGDLDRSGNWTDRLVSQQTALVAATRAADRVGQAHCHRDLGMAYLRLGQDREAAEHLHRALDMFGAAGDPGGEAHAHVNLSQLTERAGDLHAALEHSRRARERFRRAGNRAGQAYGLNMIGWKLALLGDHEQAITHCEQALDLIVAAGDTQGEADTWDSLGYAHHHLGRHHRAIECYRRAIDLFDHVGDRYGRALSDINLGDAYRAVGDDAAAQAVLRRALATLEDLGHPDATQVRADLRQIAAPVR
jgi:tetratricopeptide (TPR) repeat protein